MLKDFLPFHLVNKDPWSVHCVLDTRHVNTGFMELIDWWGGKHTKVCSASEDKIKTLGLKIWLKWWMPNMRP
jgi:hypothetical protein